MSDASPLPGDVERLLRRRLRSLTQLETLLLVRSGPQTATDVARALRISQPHAEDELTALVALPFISAEGAAYSYAASARTRATIDALAGLYPTYRTAVAQVIFGGAQASRNTSPVALQTRSVMASAARGRAKR